MPIILDSPPVSQVGTELVLDPSEVATGRVELPLNLGAIRVAPPGPDWGEAIIEQYLAEQSRGQVPVDFRVPNRQIAIPLLLGASGPAEFASAKAQLQAKVALFQREGGWLRRADGLYADITNASLRLPDEYGHLGVEADVILTLEAIPVFYGDEIELGDHVETTAAELVFAEAEVLGDYPARVRIVVDEDDGERQLGLMWGIRCRHYDAASTAALAYEAEDLTPLDTATVETLTGASGGSVVEHANLSTGWTPVLSTTLDGVGDLTHTGTYRVWARAYTTSAVPPRVRFVWDVGDLVLPEENTPVRPSGPSQFFPLDLGEVRLDPTTGTHRWLGQIHAAGDTGGENISIDKVWLAPVDEGYGVLRAPSGAQVDGLAEYVARDEFNQTAGALTGKTLPVGGTWSGAGDADDFTTNGGGFLNRGAVSDANINAGRYAIAGTGTFTDVAVQADVKAASIEPDDGLFGVLARYVDVNNWLFAGLEVHGAQRLLILRTREAGTVTTWTFEDVSSWVHGGDFFTVRLSVEETGRYLVWLSPQGSVAAEPTLTGDLSPLATGGALASGTAGLYDAQTSSGALRVYDNFTVQVPIFDAVLFASQSAELRHDGMFREDSTGFAYGPVSHVTGNLPRLPPSGLENRPVEVFLKASRGDFAQRPDAGIDDISARVYYRPSFLFPS